MNYSLELNNRSFEAIKAGTKKIEGRTPKDVNDRRYETIKQGDIINFTNNVTFEEIQCKVLFVTYYSDVRTMLETEGLKNILPGEPDVESGIDIYHSLSGYEDRIRRFGIYAIGIRPLVGQKNESVL